MIFYGFGLSNKDALLNYCTTCIRIQLDHMQCSINHQIFKLIIVDFLFNLKIFEDIDIFVKSYVKSY